MSKMLANLKLQNIVDCSNNEAIMGSTKCKLNSCPNRAGWCYILDTIHLRVLPMHMKTWSIAININEGSLEVPPNILIKQLQPARKNEINALRDNSQFSTNSS